MGAFWSLGGRITLIQSCLMHILIFFLSLFQIPASIASRIEKMKKIFYGWVLGSIKRIIWLVEI